MGGGFLGIGGGRGGGGGIMCFFCVFGWFGLSKLVAGGKRGRRGGGEGHMLFFVLCAGEFEEVLVRRHGWLSTACS